MQLEVGSIVTGKVTGITKFGAFVELENKAVGMVHISEVAASYVNDIKDHLQEGQEVKVKVMSVGDNGKISLSIKRAMPAPSHTERGNKEHDSNRPRTDRNERFGGRPNQGGGRPAQGRGNGGHAPSKPAYRSAVYTPPKPAASKSDSFEDMLRSFMQSSDEKTSDMKKNRQISRRAGQKRGS